MICGMVIIVPLSLRVLDIGIAIVPCVDFEPALVTGVDDAHCHGYEGVVGLIVFILLELIKHHSY